MKTLGASLCIFSAMVGAGFASGREILSFFTQYGAFSWVLLIFAIAGLMFLMHRVMTQETALSTSATGCAGKLGRLLTLLLSFATAGGMTAATGEIAALTLPISGARLFGMLSTLVLCQLLSKQSVQLLHALGWLLLPSLLLAVALCLGCKTASLPSSIPYPNPSQRFWELIAAMGYAGMNTALSVQVLHETAKRCPGSTRQTAIGSGLLIGGLLALFNWAFLPYASQFHTTALPTVMLLRSYGKLGFYLSAAVLYLAAISTLIAVLRTLNVLFAPHMPRQGGRIICLIVLIAAFFGFENLIATAYPTLGILCWIPLCWPIHKKKPQNAAFSLKQ